MPTLDSIVPRLPASNLARTIAFYRDVLGFTVDVAWPSAAPTFVILRRDQVSIGFFEPNHHQPGPPGYAELYIGTTTPSPCMVCFKGACRSSGAPRFTLTGVASLRCGIRTATW